MKEEAVDRLRAIVPDCLSKHLYSAAIFFSDKVAAATSDAADIYMHAQALFLGRHYLRALHFLNSSEIVLRDLRFRYLAAKCLEELKEWHQCLAMLGDAKIDEHGNVHAQMNCNAMHLDKDGEDHEINIMSAICYLRGKAYEALENRAQARLWYKAAIKADPLCYEFFLQAKTICPSDPLVYNERGVVAYHMMEMYPKAISNYEKALALSTRSLSTYAGLAYTYRLMDNFDAAIDYYHKALWLKPDDQFCTEMLTVALEEDCRGIGRRMK